MSSSQIPSPLLRPLQNLPDSLMIGVSGGVDSLSLLHAIVQSGKKPIILHFNHGWRKESLHESKSIQRLSQFYQLPFFQGKAPKNSPKTETAARELRDAFFQRASKKFKCPHLLLAHHANDQVETFLLQLFRGTGSQGGGMEAYAERNGLIRIRPWLGIWKKEIHAYALEKKLPWNEDRTNLDSHHQRNWIRNELLPLLTTQLGREIPPLLLRTATILRDQTQALYQQILPFISLERLPISTLKSLSRAHQRLLIKSWLQAHSISDPSFERIEAITTMITEAKPAKINLPAGNFVRRTNGVLWIDRSSKKTALCIKKTEGQAL